MWLCGQEQHGQEEKWGLAASPRPAVLAAAQPVLFFLDGSASCGLLREVPSLLRAFPHPSCTSHLRHVFCVPVMHAQLLTHDLC